MPKKYKLYGKKTIGVMKVYVNSHGKQFFKILGKYYPVYPKRRRR